MQQQHQGQGTNASSGCSAALLQQLAEDLLAGTAALLLHPLQGAGTDVQQQQERCTAARLWRDCLQYNLRRCMGGFAGVDVVTGHVKQRVQQLVARLPGL